MRQSIHLRGAPNPAHPPDGLFVDPHHGRHAWWSVDARTLLGLVTVLASLGTLLSIAAR